MGLTWGEWDGLDPISQAELAHSYQRRKLWEFKQQASAIIGLLGEAISGKSSSAESSPNPEKEKATEAFFGLDL